MNKRHKEWYSRGYLPHCDHIDMMQMITFRLADSLPRERLDEIEKNVGCENDGEKRRQIESFLDQGYGSCVLRETQIGSMVEDALLCFDGRRYRLIEWGRDAKSCAFACRTLFRMAPPGNTKVMEILHGS